MTLRERFDRMDTNHDGVVSAKEFVAAHPKLGAERAEKIFKKMGGGTGKGLSFEQFKTAVEKWLASRQQRKPGETQPSKNAST
jgi:Ca2+-binding EF-hand superfamily protein